MKFNIREKFNYFLKSSKDYPILAGFSVGFYAFVFYFSNNFDLVNSWNQTFFFLFYFILCPIIAVFAIYKILLKSKYFDLAATGIFITMLLLLSAYIFDSAIFLSSYKRIGVSIILIFLLFFSFVKFKIGKYKYFIVIVFLMSFLPTLKLGEMVYLNFTNSNAWQLQPDHILTAKFKKKPNIYYIQPDGYTNDSNLKNEVYRYNNSSFNNWLSENGFTIYKDYRSNYESTLSSNTSCFYMKHHFYYEGSNFKNFRDLIMGENPVLKILKNNQYKTFFITERPYLMMNKPNIYYDYTNFKNEELPFFKDGWSYYKSITDEIKKKIREQDRTNNFFFIEKFDPGHIAVYQDSKNTIENERLKYIEKLKIGNAWLKEIVSFIKKNDQNSIIIIGADHGGFVGFEYALQSIDKIKDPRLINSIFGAHLAIKWNDERHSEYDSKLKTPVNLFRILFSYLSEDKSLLSNLQPNVSYNIYERNNFIESKYYKAIDENGRAGFLEN